MGTTTDSKVVVEARQTAAGGASKANRALQQALNTAELIESSPPPDGPGQSAGGKMQRRQSFAELTLLLSEEVKEAAGESMQEVIRYAERNVRKVKSLIEDHFHIDEANFRMLGPLQQDSNLARDVHDWFNLVALVPVILTNFINWTCSPKPLCGLLEGGYRVPDLWHGDAFMLFWLTTFSYFVLDLAFIILLPKCVRSPHVIMQHHLATIAYIFVPLIRPEFGWIMGSCMSVEINTWFLIARRSFNRSGDRIFAPHLPLMKSLLLLFVSSCFYISWFVIRLGFYPYLLLVIVEEWYKESQRVGSPVNLIALTPAMQCAFIFLNVKWTVDLARSKMKGCGRGPSKGL